MKKILASALALSCLLLLASCGDKEEATTAVSPDSTVTSAAHSDDPLSSQNSDSSVEIENIFGEDFTLAPVEAYSSKDVTIDFSAAKPLFEDINAVEALESAELEFFIETKNDLVADLSTAFLNAGINVDINKETGEMSLDSTVLFGGDSAELTDEGKAFLDKFINAYTSVVFSEKFDGLISAIKVEGHTAPVAGTSYEADIPLSQNRADNVKNYCLSEETGVSQDNIAKLSDTMVAEGLSNGTPVKDSSGNVDMDASRRVAFRFLFDANAKS